MEIQTPSWSPPPFSSLHCFMKIQNSSSSAGQTSLQPAANPHLFNTSFMRDTSSISAFIFSSATRTLSRAASSLRRASRVTSLRALQVRILTFLRFPRVPPPSAVHFKLLWMPASFGLVSQSVSQSVLRYEAALFPLCPMFPP